MTDCGIPIETLDVLERRWFQKQHGRPPFYGAMELTPYCNLKCVHCYIANCHYKEDILSFTEVCRILDEVADEGCMWMLFTGGEPLLRDDFLDIYTYAKKKGLFVSLFTNGTLITPEIAQYLHDWPPQLVEITIYGATSAIHERVTGIAGSFERCLRGIELLLKHGVNLRLKSILMTINQNEYWEMKKLTESFGLRFRFDPIINPALDGSRQPCDLRLSAKEVVKWDMEDPDRRQGWIESLPLLANLPPPADVLYSCGAGRMRFNIDAFGKLSMCTIARQPEYDLRKGSFREGWRDYLGVIGKQKLSHPSSCVTCKYRDLCSVCPGWNILEYGVLDLQPVEYLCEIAHLRAEAFNFEKYRNTSEVPGGK